jgi:hypothetical protein
LLIVIPADENARSLETDDAMMARWSRARDAHTGYRCAFNCEASIRLGTCL